LESIAFEPEKAYLFSADPRWIPGNIDLRDPLVPLDVVHARVSEQGLEKVGAILINFQCLPPFSSNDRLHSLIGGEDDIACRTFSYHWFSFARCLKLGFPGDYFPNTKNLCAIIGKTRLHSNEKKDHCE
jgi:hypothetical protein